MEQEFQIDHKSYNSSNGDLVNSFVSLDKIGKFDSSIMNQNP